MQIRCNPAPVVVCIYSCRIHSLVLNKLFDLAASFSSPLFYWHFGFFSNWRHHIFIQPSRVWRRVGWRGEREKLDGYLPHTSLQQQLLLLHHYHWLPIDWASVSNHDHHHTIKLQNVAGSARKKGYRHSLSLSLFFLKLILYFPPSCCCCCCCCLM